MCMYYIPGVFNLKIKFQCMFIKMIVHFSGFSVLGFIMVSSNSFVLSEVFHLLEGSFFHKFSVLQEFPVICWSFYFLSKVLEISFKLGLITYRDRIKCQCEKQFNFSRYQCYKMSSSNPSFNSSE